MTKFSFKMSFIREMGQCIKLLTPAALALLLCLSGSQVYAQNQDTEGPQTGAETTTEQSTDTDVKADQVPQGTEAAAAGSDGLPTSEDAIAHGKQLFTQNCTVCHAIGDVVVGPALRNVHKRRTLPWLIAFVKNSQKVIQSGDATAVALYNEYNKTQMPSFNNFTDNDVKDIIAYIKSESETTGGGGDPAPGLENNPQQGQQAGDGGAFGISSTYLTAIIVALIIVLLLVLLVLVLVVAVLLKYLGQKTDLSEEDKEIVKRRLDLGKVVKSTPFIFLVVFVFTAVIGKNVIDGLYTIGVQQGYQPTQPIAFSHKLHAGVYEIDCNYCHTGVYKGKSANIPSVNICMNCHNTIKKDSPEIQKLYAAVEKDQPIQWVRIHNLPDLVNFPHAQHTSVGGIQCETCHGPIKEMEVVYQYSELTMGWCINCHRETDVRYKDNAYYDKLVKLHQEANPNEPMKVKDIGGLECARCHY